MRFWLPFSVVLLHSVRLLAQDHLSEEVQRYVTVNAPIIAITHVRVIDGTGAPVASDQTIVIANGRIQSIGSSGNVTVPDNALRLEKSGYTVIPGLVGMHNHLFYSGLGNYDESGAPHSPPFTLLNEIPVTATRLYLACGVTTMRTTGSIEPYTDLNVKKAIDNGQMPGPRLYLTAPYLEGQGAIYPQMHELTTADETRRMVEFWADSGFTSFKAYRSITREQLKAAIEEAHRHGLKITGHLCSIGYREAAEMGIDNIEHGFTGDSEFVSTKRPDVCPPRNDVFTALTRLDANAEPVITTFRTLINHHVAVTSTLPTLESNTGKRPPLQQRVMEAMSPQARANYLSARIHAQAGTGIAEALLKKNMQLEFAFVKAGGTLLAGPDPTGNGGVLPGFGDQREIELLVEAGFTPIDAVQIATHNGAEFLGVLSERGTVEPGKRADLVLIHGDPSMKIDDIENVETVFKDGVGYDSARLIESVRGQVGLR